MIQFLFIYIESIGFIRFYVKIFAVNAKGRSPSVNLKASTVKETSRLPLLPPEQSIKLKPLFYSKQCSSRFLWEQWSCLHQLPKPAPAQQAGADHLHRTGQPGGPRLHRDHHPAAVQVPVPGPDSFLLTSLYLSSAQVGGGAGSLREGEAGVHTATTSTSPLSARELVEISLLRSADTEEDMGSLDRPGIWCVNSYSDPLWPGLTADAGLVSVPASGSVLSNYPLLISADRQINNTSGNILGIFYLSWK